jgi:site-specific DNA recombinase
MKSVIYARYSSDNQREESITAQVRACTEYAKAKGYTVVKVYTDEARSATTDDRPGFKAMINDAKLSLFDVLLVHKLDRFSRDRYDSVYYKRELKKAGVRLISVLEHLDDSPESVILESVIEGMAEYYSRNLAREALKGMRENALQCRHNGGRPPLGYDVDKETGRYLVNERESRTVKLVFELYDKGYGYDRIIDQLKHGAHRTKGGRPFGKNSLHDILRNEKYVGVYVFNRSAAKEFGKRNHHRHKLAGEIIRIPGGVPQIIEKELWERVQEKMDKRRQNSEKARMRAKTIYLLTGKVFCGECGSAVVGNTASDRGRRYHYYECGLKDRTRSCDNKRIRKSPLEDLVIREIEENIFGDQVLAKVKQKLIVFLNQYQKDRQGELGCLRKELVRVERSINQLLDQIEEGFGGASVAARLKDRETEQALYQTRLAELEAKAATDAINEQVVNEYLDKMKEFIKNKDDEDTLKHLVSQFVCRVILFKDEVEVTLKILVTNGGGGAYLIVTKVKKAPPQACGNKKRTAVAGFKK